MTRKEEIKILLAHTVKKIKVQASNIVENPILQNRSDDYVKYLITECLEFQELKTEYNSIRE